MQSKLINKHNSITDALTNYSLTAEKLLNAIYYTWLETNKDSNSEINTLDLPIADLKVLIGMQSDGNNDLVFDALEELRFSQRFRNFDYKGRQVKYLSGSFVSELVVYKDNQNYANLTISPRVIEALKQKAGYTPIELEIVEKFKTKYAYKIFQLWRRYYTLPNKEQATVGKIEKTLEELNVYFNTKFVHRSKMKEALDRGVKEINKILGKEELYVVLDEKDKKNNTFTFCWGREDPKLATLTTFQNYIRKNFVNSALSKFSGKDICVSDKGLLYEEGTLKDLTNVEAKIFWEKIYSLAKDGKLYSIKQQKLL